MRLTTKTDFCVRALIYLQMNKKKVKIKEIADFYKISKNHMSVAINLLSELGYVNSTLGPQGGVEFNAKFKDHLVSDLIYAVEGFNLVECFNDKTNTCTITKTCKMKKMLSSATHAFLDELKKYKIKDLV